MAPDNDEDTFSISITGAGVTVNREVSAVKFAQLMSVLMGNSTPDMPDNHTPVGRSVGSVKVSLREFLDEAKASTKPDQIVAIGQYMSLHEAKDTFSRDDIKSRFQAARERLPSNFPRDFGTTISKGMVAEDHAMAGQFYVTKKGVGAVERQFGAQG